MSNENLNLTNQKNKLQLSSLPFRPKRRRNPEDSQNSNNSNHHSTLKEIVENKKFKKYIPKIMRNNEESEKMDEIKLSLDAKEYIPNKEKLKNREKEKEEKEEREKIQKEKEDKIKKEYIYSYEYLIQFETWELSNKTDSLPEDTLNHINQIEEELKEKNKFYPSQKSKINYSNCNTSKSSSSSAKSFCMEQWARKDYTNEIKVAEENKKKFKESDEKDKTKNELRELLNILTKDNYEEIKVKILEIIKENVNYQEQFLDVFFLKAVLEKAYDELYAKLCKYLNKKLPQKTQKNENTKNPSSMFRDNLIKKCKEVLKSKNFDKYIKEDDPIEKKIKIKKFILGNANFITELIKSKLLSKKVMSDCVDYLFERFENDKDSELKIIHVESIVVFTNKFGTFLHFESKNMKAEEASKYKEKLEVIFKKLEILKNDKSLPGLIRYQIINLIEKKKNNYVESKFERSLTAKSSKELVEELKNKEKEKEIEKEEEKKEIEEEDKEEEQEEINEKIKNDLMEYKDFIEEEGSSEKYPWTTTTILYDEKLKAFDDIVEGYIVGSSDFIDKKSDNAKYAKDYIRELVGYYNEKMNAEEKKDLQKRIFDLFEIVNDLAFETPKIYDIYAYVIYIFIQNNIMKVIDLEKIFKKEMNEKDISTLNKIYKIIYDLNKKESFKKELKNFKFVKKNKGLFEWMFNEKASENI